MAIYTPEGIKSQFSNISPYSRILKDTLVVDLSDRITDQKVYFRNKDNIFAGTFVGTLSANGPVLNGSLLSDVVLDGAKVVNPDGTKTALSGVVEKTRQVESKVENVEDKVEELSSGKLDGDSAWKVWSRDERYSVRDIVSYGGKLWKAVSESEFPSVPGTPNSQWEAVRIEDVISVISIPDAYKTYKETRESLSGDGYLTKVDLTVLNDYAKSNELSGKQDKLPETQISTLESLVEQGQTTITFTDGTT